MRRTTIAQRPLDSRCRRHFRSRAVRQLLDAFSDNQPWLVTRALGAEFHSVYELRTLGCRLVVRVIVLDDHRALATFQVGQCCTTTARSSFNAAPTYARAFRFQRAVISLPGVHVATHAQFLATFLSSDDLYRIGDHRLGSVVNAALFICRSRSGFSVQLRQNVVTDV